MVNKCTNSEELSYFNHHSTVIRPVNILLDVGQTILIGGICHLLSNNYFVLDK
jgi:hypothetical protein